MQQSTEARSSEDNGEAAAGSFNPVFPSNSIARGIIRRQMKMGNTIIRRQVNNLQYSGQQ